MTSKFAQAEYNRKKPSVISLRLKHRLLYGKPRHNTTGKELDGETGLYYYGARYLDPRTSRWLSGDPALGEYLPSAPINDEARKRNGNLPGQGGVFNLVNLHVYHYAGNNPVKYIDPDGKKLNDAATTLMSSSNETEFEAAQYLESMSKRLKNDASL